MSPHAAGHVRPGRPRRRRLDASAGGEWEKNGSASGFEDEMALRLLVALEQLVIMLRILRPVSKVFRVLH